MTTLRFQGRRETPHRARSSPLFADAGRQHPDAVAVLIGSLNGHAFEDLKGLNVVKASGAVRCPVIVGGNLSVGSEKKESDKTRLYGIGVDYVLSSPEEILLLLNRIGADQHERRVS